VEPKTRNILDGLWMIILAMFLAWIVMVAVDAARPDNEHVEVIGVLETLDQHQQGESP
jgi:hypothetical protein